MKYFIIFESTMNKTLQTKLFFILFFLIVTVDSLGIVLNEMILRYIFKPLISLSLMALYLVMTAKVNLFYIVALIFAFVADVLLLNSSNEFFMLALGSFLLMHLSYLIIITADIYNYNTKKLSVILVPFLIVLVLVIVFTSQGIKEFLWPIIVYGLIVCAFGALSFYHYLERKSDTSLMIFFGAFFFIISNGMSAIEKFRLENRDLAVGIMFTYTLAQLLICLYMIRKSNVTPISNS